MFDSFILKTSEILRLCSFHEDKEAALMDSAAAKKLGPNVLNMLELLCIANHGE